MTPGAIAVTRGCGTRKQGGIYFETGLSPYGQTLEYFIADPPILVDNWNLSAVGVQLIERQGVTHIVDWVGSKHYPNVADYLEEVRRFGLSRRLAKTLDFSRLTKQTRILLVHARAWVENFTEYRAWTCPKDLAHHLPDVLRQEPEADKRMCAGVWWQDIEGGISQTGDPLQVKREMPSFSYSGRCRPEGVKPQYRPAIFASFPCSRLVVVKGQGFEESYQRASRAQVEITEVDQ
ncbi:MAG: hypothetical protein KME35_24300 [Aphanocapsa sp. GSE-SYN-MK-11-07L]|jgi:hypothetical protein|nr:hypothetical protein [Aphanocapsa sp. GSE-SYN-MK-11-07L]